jgi:hypothetical protein
VVTTTFGSQRSTPPRENGARGSGRARRADGFHGVDSEPTPAAEVDGFLRAIWHSGDVREVRVLGVGRFGRDTDSGYFDDPAKLARAVVPYDGKANIYVTINPVDPALLARAANRIKRAVRETSRDKDVVKRSWFLVDVDAVRPSGISATDEEVAATLATTHEIVTHLEVAGFRKPIVSMSGNGHQLLYPVDLENDGPSKELVEGILSHLAERFDSDSVKVDTSVANAARLSVVTGTFKVKGDATADRPHRRSVMVSGPDELKPLPVETLRAVSDPTGADEPSGGPAEERESGTEWVRQWLEDAGIEYRAGQRDGITWFTLRDCPWHEGEDTWKCGVGQRADGAAVGHCFHDRGKGKRWEDFRDALGLHGTAEPAEGEHAGVPVGAKQAGKSQGEQLHEAMSKADVDLFHDADHRTYATFERDGHRETWPIRSTGFRRYVSWLYYRRFGKAPRAQALSEFLGTIEGQAQWEGSLRSAHVRIAPTDDGIAIDMGDEGWTAVEVTSDGWRHIANPAVRFVRPPGMLALPAPTRGGTIELLRPFVNVSDEAAWVLVIGFLIMMFRASGPYPILGLRGEQGSAKSTLMRLIRRCVDPREALDRSAPRDDRDLAIHAMHHRVIALDNLSVLPAWLSDALARLATGAGFSTRTLYTDADEFTVSVSRPVMVNGIGDIIQRSDLLDRAVLVDLEPIPESRRKLEADIRADFDSAFPGILGALLDAVSMAIRRESSVTADRWPRMADFARWVSAAEPALDWPDGSFLRAYHANRGHANELALDADPIGAAVQGLMKARAEWEGTASMLLEVLASRAGEQVARRKDWPGAANALSSRIWRLAPNFRTIGIDVQRGRVGSARTIRLSNHRPSSSSSSSASWGPFRTGPQADGGPPREPPDPSRDRHPSTPGQASTAHDSDGHDDGDGPPQRSDTTVLSDLDTASDGNEAPVCECGHPKVATQTGRWVCTYGPGHPLSRSSDPPVAAMP